MSRPIKETHDSQLNNAFREELKIFIQHKLNEINHCVSGCDSPFTYIQISDTQEKLCEIADILGISFQGDKE